MRFRADALPFDLGSLEVFVAVSEHGAMATASRRLGLTQPAVSQTIAELERRTGTKLFDRSVRPLALTPAGSLLQQRASALLAEARQIPPLLQDAEQGKPPQIRVGLVDSLAHALTAPLAAFLARRAREVSILSGLTEAHAGAMLTRRLDMFLGVDELPDLDGLERYPLWTESYVLAVPSAGFAPQSAADLRAFAMETPLIRYSARSETGREVERYLRRLELDIPRRFEFDTPHGVTAMVEAGFGFAITTPLCLIEANPAWSKLAIAPLPEPRLRRTLTLVARRSELGSLPKDAAGMARAVIEECVRTFFPAPFPLE
jgi:DNA-binding transcriptional LysR family regulator